MLMTFEPEESTNKTISPTSKDQDFIKGGCTDDVAADNVVEFEKQVPANDDEKIEDISNMVQKEISSMCLDR